MIHGKLFPCFTDEPFDILIGNILNLALVVDGQQCHVSIVADQYCQRLVFLLQTPKLAFEFIMKVQCYAHTVSSSILSSLMNSSTVCNLRPSRLAAFTSSSAHVHLLRVLLTSHRVAIGSIVHTRYSYFVLSHILLPKKRLQSVQNNSGLT